MEEVLLLQKVRFRGHPLITATHETTLEITTDESLTERGDCIVGVCASSGCAGLSPELKRAIARDGSRVNVRLMAGGHAFLIRARGDDRLTLTDTNDIVIRKSGYVCGRTLAVMANASAADMPRDMVKFLREKGAEGTLEIEVCLG